VCILHPTSHSSLSLSNLIISSFLTASIQGRVSDRVSDKVSVRVSGRVGGRVEVLGTVLASYMARSPCSHIEEADFDDSILSSSLCNASATCLTLPAISPTFHLILSNDMNILAKGREEGGKEEE